MKYPFTEKCRWSGPLGKCRLNMTSALSGRDLDSGRKKDLIRIYRCRTIGNEQSKGT